MHLFHMRYPQARLFLNCALALLFAVMFQGTALASRPILPPQDTFETPEAAVEALVKALGANNMVDLYTIFGPGSASLISSGDKVDDREASAKFVRLYGEKNRLENVGDRKVILHAGNNDWPFPIPLVKTGKKWHFDTRQGKEEIINRRIGRNELDAIQTCLAIVDAQREYATMDHNGDGLLEYAQQFQSTKGKTDGLYWETGASEDPSPLGPLVARARSEGYVKRVNPAPYRGYFYRILTAQGKHAQGGAFSYLVNGRMVGGFAIVGYPANYGASGIKTFIVNHAGVVYEKDLGPKTIQRAKTMKAFDPDKTWERAE